MPMPIKKIIILITLIITSWIAYSNLPSRSIPVQDPENKVSQPNNKSDINIKGSINNQLNENFNELNPELEEFIDDTYEDESVAPSTLEISQDERQEIVDTVVAKNLKKAKKSLRRKSKKLADPSITVNEIFSSSEVQELNDSNNQGFIPGGYSSRYASVSNNAASTTDDSQDTTKSTNALTGLYYGQARGYTMLYMMHPNARATAEQQFKTLIASDVLDIYLSVLTDGTFGKDFSYLQSKLSQLNAEKRWITLHLFLTNGPTMRVYDSTPITAGFNRISPDSFRRLIQYDSNIRNRFIQMVREVKPIFEFNRSLNEKNRNIATVMLEDNLDSDSYRAMRELAESELGDLVKFYRNPCEGCYDGNDSNSLGDPIEAHLPQQIPQLSFRDGFSLDGVSYNFELSNNDRQKGMEINQLEDLIIESQKQKIQYFGLWRQERQGLYGNGNPHPDERVYEVPTAEQSRMEESLLNFGLDKIASDN